MRHTKPKFVHRQLYFCLNPIFETERSKISVIRQVKIANSAHASISVHYIFQYAYDVLDIYVEPKITEHEHQNLLLYYSLYSAYDDIR